MGMRLIDPMRYQHHHTDGQLGVERKTPWRIKLWVAVWERAMVDATSADLPWYHLWTARDLVMFDGWELLSLLDDLGHYVGCPHRAQYRRWLLGEIPQWLAVDVAAKTSRVRLQVWAHGLRIPAVLAEKTAARLRRSAEGYRQRHELTQERQRLEEAEGCEFGVAAIESVIARHGLTEEETDPLLVERIGQTAPEVERRVKRMRKLHWGSRAASCF